MPVCESCGNNYDKTFQIVLQGKPHIFDSFECAIHMLAPHCNQCGCKVIGHGVEAGEKIFCGAHCAQQAGIHGLKDRN